MKEIVKIIKMKKELILKIKENLDKLGVNLDCSRFEESYGGYCDSREWFMRFVDKEIDIDKYLNGLSEEKLKLMVEKI